jgi:glycosyltransferase 2 family protein
MHIPIRVTISIVLVGLLLLNTNPKDLWLVLVNANIPLVLSTSLLWFFSLYVSSLRWNTILKVYGVHFSNKLTFDLYWIGSFFNNFLPTSIGGDIYKFYGADKHSKNNRAAIISSLIVDRAMGLIMMIWIILAFSPAFVSSGLVSMFCIFLLITTLILFYSFFYIDTKISYVSTSKWINEVIEKLNILLSFKDLGSALYSLGYSLLFVLISSLATQIFFIAVGYTPPFFILLFILPIVDIASMLPVSLNSLGVREGVGVFLFSTFGIPAEIAFAALILGRIMQLLFSMTGGVKYVISSATYKSD